MSVFVLGSLGAVEHLEQSTEDEYQSSASGIEGLPGNEGFGGGGTPTTPPPTLPATTTTHVDASPTTTTTTVNNPTTTTTGGGGTTTTTVAVNTVVTAVTDVSQSINGGKWNARAEVQLRNSQTQAPIVGASVPVRMEAANGSATTKSCTTGSQGTCVAAWNNLRSKHTPIIASVLDVTASPSWDEQVVTGTLVKP